MEYSAVLIAGYLGMSVISWFTGIKDELFKCRMEVSELKWDLKEAGKPPERGPWNDYR